MHTFTVCLELKTYLSFLKEENELKGWVSKKAFYFVAPAYFAVCW